MRTYQCPNCLSSFTEADNLWDVAINSDQCPKCSAPLKDFPGTKPENTKSTTNSQRPSSWKWTFFVVCTILFGTSPYIFMLINIHIIHGRGELNNYFLYIIFTVPAAFIVLLIGLIAKSKMDRG